jgi:predicted dehydrogenase
MSSPIRIGVIGAGGIVAKMHLPDLAGNKNYKVTLLGGRKESRLKLLAERFAIPRWTTHLDDVIADKNVDAVIIGTPHPAHVSWGLKAIAAGKHVLMQKPLCGDLGEANAFVNATEKTDRTVLCLPHFSPTIYTIRQKIQDGVIGRVSGARCRTSHGGPEVYYAEVRDLFQEGGAGKSSEGKADLWFFDSKRAGVGALFDMGVYAVAHLVALLGNVKKVTGFVATLDKPTDLEDAATLVMQFESGALATAETSWCDPARTWELSVHGTAGKFISPGLNGADATHWMPTSYTREDSPPKSEPLTAGAGVGGLHEHFRECIQKGVQPPLSNAQAARHVTEILLGGLQSARTGRAVDIHSKAGA